MQQQLQVRNTSRDRRCVVLGGAGGVGKTQLAVAFARQHQSAYRSVFWLNATSETTVKISFRQMAEVIFDQQSLADFEDDAILEGVRQWLSRSQNAPWLMVVDNYDEPDVYTIDKYYPVATHGSIIVTTRLPSRVSDVFTSVKPLRKIEDSLAVLQTRSRRTNIDSDPYAHQLAKRLDGLPLALVTAGAYLGTCNLTFQEYLELYEQRWRVDAQRPQRLQGYDRTLYTTWNLSYARLEKENPEAARILQLLAYFDHQEVWYGLWRAGRPDQMPEWLQSSLMEPFGFESVMRTLVEYCFVEARYMSRSYSTHSCVHDWTLGELNREIDPQLYWYAFDCVAASLDDDDWEVLNQTKYGRVSPHGVRLTHHRFEACDEAEDGLSQRLDDAEWIVSMLQDQVQLSAAEQMYERALTGKKRALGPDHSSTLETVNSLGILYHAQGKLEEAEQMHTRALAGYEKALGPDHTSTLNSQYAFAKLYHKQGKLDLAESTFQRVLTSFETTLGDHHLWTISLINDFGLLYDNQDRREEARWMYRRALTGCQERLGLEHPKAREVANNLDRLDRHEGKKREESPGRERYIGVVGFNT